MFTAITVAVVIIVALVLYNAYLLWYAKSGRYEMDRRIDSVTK